LGDWSFGIFTVFLVDRCPSVIGYWFMGYDILIQGFDHYFLHGGLFWGVLEFGFGIRIRASGMGLFLKTLHH
jgi:hypothetical protein